MASPWEDYLRTVGLGSGANDYSNLVLGGGGRGAKLFTIGGSSEPQYSSEDLATAVGSYQSGQRVLQALGEEEKKDKGFLSSALSIIDKPRAVVFSGLKELADAVGSGDASWSDFSKNVSEGYGAGDIQLLKMREGDSGWMKALKGAGAFAGDVLADPLTYVSFGTAGIAKKAGIEATEAVAKRALQEGAEKIGRETIEELATRGLDDVAKATLLEAGEDALLDKAAQRLGAEMAEGYAKSRSRGLFDKLVENLGDDAGKDIFENTVPSALQGGISVRLPFMKDEFGLTKTIGIGKGGTLTRGTGIDTALDAISGAKNAVRFSDNAIGRAIDWTVRSLGGADGEAYAKAMRNLYKADPALGGFYEYNALRAATKGRARALATFRQDAGSVVGILHDFAYKKGAPAEAKDLVNKYFMNRAALAEAADTTLTGTAKELDDQARAIAKRMTDLFDDYAAKAKEAFGDEFGVLDDYIPLMMSKQAKEALEQNIPVGSLGRGRKDWKVLRSRERFTTTEVLPDGTTVERWMTPVEANARLRELAESADRAAGRPLKVIDDAFETDPMELMVNYSEGMSRAISQRRFVKELFDRGVLVKTSRSAAYSPNVERFAKATRGFAEDELYDMYKAGTVTPETIITEFGKVLDASNADDLKFVDDMVTTLISDRLSDVKSTQEALRLAREDAATAAARGAAGEPEELVSLAKAAEQAKENLLAALEGQGVIAAKREAIDLGLVGKEANEYVAKKSGNTADWVRYNRSVEEAAASTGGPDYVRIRDFTGGPTIISEKSVPGADAESLIDAGMKAVGQGAKDVIVPDVLSDTFASGIVLDAVNKMITINTKAADAGIREAYEGYMRFWRASATFGRGPGFAIRNAQSGLWQNFLIGVNGRDYSVANAIVQGRRQALKAAEEEGARLGSVIAGSDLERFVENFLESKLSRVKVGRGNAFDVYKAARDEGQVFDDFVVLPAFEGESLTSGVKRYTGAEMSIIDPNKSKEELGALGKAANVVAGSNPLGKTTKKLNSTAEQYLRVAATSNGIRKYGSDEAGRTLASLLMKGAHFDYSNLSDFERKYMRNILPFYTWSRNSIPQGFRALLFEPGKVNAFFRANENAKEAFGTDEAMYNEWLPEWIDEKFGWAIGTKIAGKQLSISPEASILDVNKYFSSSGVPDIKEFISGLSPAAKLPIEALSQQDLFTGAKYKPEGIEAPGWAQALMSVPVVGDIAGAAMLERTGSEGETLVNQTIMDFLREAVPAVGTVERLVPGVGGERDKERMLSSYLSQLAGLGTATLSDRQIAGELRSRTDDIGSQINNAIGELGLDEQAVRDSVNRLGPELTATYIAQGYFKRR